MAVSGLGNIKRWSTPPRQYWTCHSMRKTMRDAQLSGKRVVLLRRGRPADAGNNPAPAGFVGWCSR